MILASLLLKGFNCSVMEMSDRADYVEVSNPTTHPHWITIHEQGLQRLESWDWDKRCQSCSLRRLLTGSNIHTTRFLARQNTLRIDIIAKEKDYEQFLSSLSNSGIDFAVSTVHMVSGNKRLKGLTVNQLHAVRLALETGYFDSPKKINIRRLSEKFGCSPSTMCETLRRAEKNIMKVYVDFFDTEQMQKNGLEGLKNDYPLLEMKSDPPKVGQTV